MKARQRGFTTIAAALTAIAVIALGSAGVAGADVVNTDPEKKCNTDGRQFCIDLSTYSGITASEVREDGDGTRYTWAEWKVTNTGGSTLTNPRVTVSLTDFCGGTDVCKTGTPPAASVTSEFVLPSGGGGPCKYGATHATLVCTYANLPAGTGTSSSTSPTKVYFKTALVPATSTTIDAVATVKERGNDANGDPSSCLPADPNCDTHKVSVTTSYEGDELKADTFALNNGTFYLATNDKLSSFRFKSDSATPLQATFNSNTAVCDTPSPTCYGRELSVLATPATPGYNDGPVVFYAQLTDLPSGVNANNVVARHIYDKVTFAVSANRFSPPSGMDARLDKVELESTGLTYFVVGVNTTTNTFQLSSTSGGPPLPFPDGTEKGVPTRVIGDQSFERTTKGCTFTYSNQIPVPSICAKKPQGLQAVDVWIWDSSNGGIKFGPT